MKAQDLIDSKAVNTVRKGSVLTSLEDLKESGTGMGGIRLQVGQTIEFPEAWDPKLVMVSTMSNGNKSYHIKVLLDNAPTWVALGSFRRRPNDIEALKQYTTNYELCSQINDFILTEFLVGKTITVSSEQQFEFPMFDKSGQRIYSDNTDQEGKVVRMPVLTQRSIPIFAWK